MDILRQVTRYIEYGWAHVSWCLSGPLSAPACKTFWTWTSIAAVVVGLFVLWKLLAWLLRPIFLRLEETRLRARERKVADADTMARYKVDDKKLYSGPTEDNVAQQIRDALAKKKIEDQQQRHHQTLGDKKL